MKIPILALIFQGIPEQIAVVTLAFVIANIPLKWKKIVPMGILLAITSYLVRQLPITFGIHTIILIGLLLGFLVLWGKGSLNEALIASLVSFLTLIITETVCISIIISVFHVTAEIISSDWKIRFLIGLPQLVLIIFVSFMFYRLKKARYQDYYKL